MKHVSGGWLLAMSLVTFQASPALAAPEPRAVTAPPEPWVAAALSGLSTPVVALGLGALAGTIQGGGGDPMFALMATPLLMGAGQVYAGDWQRGLWVGLGGEAVVLGAGLAAARAANPSETGAGVMTALIAVGAGTAYAVWAGFDAHETARRAGKPPAAPQP